MLTQYDRVANFVQYALQHPTSTYNPADHDAEFNSLIPIIAAIAERLDGVTRDDGRLTNGSVSLDTLSQKLLSILVYGSATVKYNGAWLSGKLYLAGAIVSSGDFVYLVVDDYTSGATIQADIAANRLTVVGYDVGVAGGVLQLDTNGLIPLAFIPTLSLDKIPVLTNDKIPVLTNDKIPTLTADKIPQLDASKISSFRTQVTFSFAANGYTFTVNNAKAVTGSKIVAQITGRVGDAIGDELEMDSYSTSARCLTDGVVTIRLSSDGLILGQFDVDYVIY